MSTTPCPSTFFIDDTLPKEDTPLRDINSLSPDSEDDSDEEIDIEDDISRLGDNSQSDRDLSDLEDDLFDQPTHARQPTLAHPPLPFEPQPSLSTSQRHTQQLALAADFCAVTARSSVGTGRCLMTCVRGGRGGHHHSSLGAGERAGNSHTSKCDCQWAVLWRRETIEHAHRAGRTKDDRLWFPYIIDNTHNHEPQRGADIAYLRRMSRTPEINAAIHRHISARLEVTQIVRLIQTEFPAALVTRSDVHNIRHHYEASL